MDQQRSVDLWLSGQRNSNIRYVLVNLVEFWNSKMLRRQPPGRPVTHGGFIKNFDWGRIAGQYEYFRQTSAILPQSDISII